MQLRFGKLETHSFMPFEDEVFDFDSVKGLTLVKGVNHDIPDETNGAGKCLDPETLVEIEEPDPETAKDLLEITGAREDRLSVTLFDIYRLYRARPGRRGKIRVRTRFGFLPVNDCRITAYDSDVYEIRTSTGKSLKASPDHLLYTHNRRWEKVRSLTTEHSLCTRDGLEKIASVEKLPWKQDLYDIEVAEKHEYYANGIVSHNSCLFLGMLYALFGELQNKLKNESMVNRYAADKDMRVSLEFSANGVPYRAVRGLARGKTSYLELYEAGRDVTKSTMAETQRFLEKEVLGCSAQSFSRTIFLTSSQNYNFYEMKRPEKKEFIEQLFDIGVFGEIYKMIHKDANDLDRKIGEALNRIMVLRKNEQQYAQMIERHEKETAELAKSAAARVEEAKARLEKARAEYRDVDAGKRAEYENAKDKLAVKARASDAAVRAHELAAQKHSMQAGRAAAEAKRIADGIKKNQEITSRLCDDCRPVMAEYFDLDRHQAEIAERKSEAERENAAASSEKEKAAAEQARRAKIDVRAAGIDKELREMAAKADGRVRAVAQAQADLAQAERDRNRAENGVNPYTEMAEENRRSLAAEEESLAAMQEEYRYLKEAESVVAQDTLRKFIIQSLIGLLNNGIKTYLTRLGSRYSVVFDADMDYRFMTDGGECEYNNFSAGEKMRIMMSTSFAFRDFMAVRNGLESNILVLDEYFDSAISSSCVRRMLDLLEEYAGKGKNVFVVSHRPEVDQDVFDNIVTVEKKDGVSRVVSEQV